MNKFKGFLNRYFKIEERGSKISTEIIAGLITFLSMCYVLFANVNTLSVTGMNPEAIFTATAIAAIIGTALMGVLANYPIGLAPGMGMNALFAYTICGAMGYTFQEALAMVLISGIVFLLISVTGLRKTIINAIPASLKKATGAGIGLFIAYVGLKGAGVLEISGADFPQIGDLTNPAVLVAIVGIVLTIVLFILKVKGAIIIGIVGTTVLNVILHAAGVDVGITKLGTVVGLPKAPEFGAFIDGFKSMHFSIEIVLVIFTLLFLDFFDTAGTLVTVGSKAGLVSEEGELINCEKALFCDATATVMGAIVGTSSTTSYVESMAGVEAGGRTGLTAVVIAILFAVSLFFGPLTKVVTSACTCAALVMVGILMMQQVKDIEWEDISVAVPAFITIILMPLSYSIAIGIAAGFIFYTIAQIASKKIKEISVITWCLTALFIIYFVVHALKIYS